MTIENEVYYVYESEGDSWYNRLVDEDKDVFEDGVCTEVKVNPEHYYKGYFFWNDMDDYEDKDEHHPLCVNSMEDIDAYMDANDSGGHFQCTYIEEWVDGQLINTKKVSDADGWIS